MRRLILHLAEMQFEGSRKQEQIVTKRAVAVAYAHSQIHTVPLPFGTVLMPVC